MTSAGMRETARPPLNLSIRNIPERNLIAVNWLLSCSCLILLSCLATSRQTGMDYE
ncbi:hypothetical protein AGR1C_Cc10804 [Agrobacterium fabacearum TT111]|nr:hypothetical protein AGR1C_Cc10804 [Agrobacterium fabacearum TT111]